MVTDSDRMTAAPEGTASGPARMNVLLTGAAGFIGMHTALLLAREGMAVTGVDNLNDYYDPELKLDRLGLLGFDRGAAREAVEAPVVSARYPGLRFMRLDVGDAPAFDALMERGRFTHVVHLAAQAGVRNSIERPYDYLHSNLQGFLNILEAVRHNPVRHLVYASSSSVYGDNAKTPFAETDITDSPASLYAATKKSNELMAHAYASLYGIPATGLRFFTVYGPYGRPDMAPMIFADAIMGGRPLKVFNAGDMSRDFTYISDIVRGLRLVLSSPPAPGVNRVYNIGHGSPVRLLDFISTLEEILGRTVAKEMLPMQPGDVPVTYADTTALRRDFGFVPQVGLRQGLTEFADWLLDYRNNKK